MPSTAFVLFMHMPSRSSIIQSLRNLASSDIYLCSLHYLELHYDSKSLKGVYKKEHILGQKNHYIRPGPATRHHFFNPPHNCLQSAHKHLSIGLCLSSDLCYPHISILVTHRLMLHTLGVMRLTLLDLDVTGVSLGLSSDLS
jgi:hypothetical protein